MQAAEGRSDTFELARNVSDHQNRLRAATRKIMATVSELSMYQVCTTLGSIAFHSILDLNPDSTIDVCV